MFFFSEREMLNTCAHAQSWKIVCSGYAAISDPLVSYTNVHSRMDLFPIFVIGVEDIKPKALALVHICSYIFPAYYSADVSGWSQIPWAQTLRTKPRENPSSVISVFFIFTNHLFFSSSSCFSFIPDLFIYIFIYNIKSTLQDQDQIPNVREKYQVYQIWWCTSRIQSRKSHHMWAEFSIKFVYIFLFFTIFHLFSTS